MSKAMTSKEDDPNYGAYAHAVFSGSGYIPWVYPKLDYYYYDTPGDRDLAKKVIYTAPFACGIFAAIGLHDVSLLHKPKNVAGYVSRMMFWTIPPIGLTAAFCTGTYAATRLLKKDTPFSHFWGGAAAGWFVGAWRGCVLTGFNSGIALGILASIKKYCVDNDIEILPDNLRPSGPAWGAADYSVFPDDRPRGWTSDPNEA